MTLFSRQLDAIFPRNLNQVWMARNSDYNYGTLQDSKDSILFLKCTSEELLVRRCINCRLCDRLFCCWREFFREYIKMEKTGWRKLGLWKWKADSFYFGSKQIGSHRSRRWNRIPKEKLSSKFCNFKWFLQLCSNLCEAKLAYWISIPETSRYSICEK